MNRYRTLENNNGKCMVQKKGLLLWIWLDTHNRWCNWYGSKYPRIFDSRSEAKKFIDGNDYKTITYYP